MTAPEWKIQWHRLDSFHVRADVDRAKLSAEWFAQLQHWHVEAVEYGITRLIGSATENFLPALGILKEFIQERIDKYQRTDGKCATCHGSSWIESAPFKSNGMIYEGVCMRCPDCGIPAPQYADPSNRQPLTSREYAEWRMGDAPKQYMPEGLQAHPFPPEDFTDMKTAMDRLHLKLFGFARPKKTDQDRDGAA
jgi:hypothetical protein